MPTSSWKSANYDLNLASCSHNLISPQCYLLLNAAAVFFSSIFFLFFLFWGARGEEKQTWFGENHLPPQAWRFCFDMMCKRWNKVTERGWHGWYMCEKFVKVKLWNKSTKTKFGIQLCFFFYVPTTCAGQIWTTAPPPNVANTTNYYTELLPHWTLPAPHVHNSDSFLRESENVFAWTLTDPTRLLPEKQPMGADITSPPPPCCSFCKFHQGPDGTVTCTVQSGEKFIKCLDWTGGRRWWSHIWCLHNEAQSRYSTARYQNLLVPLKPSLNSGSKVSVKLCCRGLITHYLVFRCTHRSIRQPSSYKMTCCICPTLNHSQLRPNQDCI